MYKLKFASYCGMVSELTETDDLAEIRADAARILRRAHREGEPVTTLERGERWEFLEPDDCGMVPDTCGELYVAHYTFPCRECGYEHETRDAASECCAYEPEEETEE